MSYQEIDNEMHRNGHEMFSSDIEGIRVPVDYPEATDRDVDIDVYIEHSELGFLTAPKSAFSIMRISYSCTLAQLVELRDMIDKKIEAHQFDSTVYINIDGIGWIE